MPRVSLPLVAPTLAAPTPSTLTQVTLKQVAPTLAAPRQVNLKQATPTLATSRQATLKQVTLTWDTLAWDTHCRFIPTGWALKRSKKPRRVPWLLTLLRESCKGRRCLPRRSEPQLPGKRGRKASTRGLYRRLIHRGLSKSTRTG